MLKPIVLAVMALLLSTAIWAQRKVVSGYLKDSLTHLPIAGGHITNTTSKQTTTTDQSGFFHMAAAPNDLLYAIAKDYRYDTVGYSLLFSDTITLYLPPAGSMLQNVTVSAGYERYRMDSLARRRAFEEARGQTYQAVEKRHTEGFGLVINLDRFFKPKYKSKKKDEQSFDRTEQMAYINYRFTPQLVALYTGLKGDALLRFMQYARPSYEWLRQHPYREQLIDYISNQLKAYKQSKSF